MNEWKGERPIETRIILDTMRDQAWERAKGELRSLLSTYWDGDTDAFRKKRDAIEGFIERCEQEGTFQ
jgi:hypothetical protein